MRATLERVTAHTPRVISYFFKPEVPLRFVAGEYTELYLAHESPDDRGEIRKFTIASAPHEPLIEILVSFPLEKPSTFKQALRALEPGDAVQLRETTGDFVLPKDPTVKLHFIAGGIGISPVLSIVRWLQTPAQSEQHRAVSVMHGVSDPALLFGAELFTNYGIRYQPIVKHPTKNWDGLHGPLTAKHIIASFAPAAGDLVYIAGPEALVNTLKADLQALGIEGSQIVTDAFTGI